MTYSEDVEWLIKNYRRNHSDAKRFKVLAKISNNGLAFVYLSTCVIGLVFIFILSSIPNFPNTVGGIEDFIAILSVTIGLILSTIIFFAASSRVKRLDFTQRTVGYHYLADAAVQLRNENYDMMMDSLEKLGRYTSRYHVLSPKREEELVEYIDRLSELPKSQLEESANQSFPSNLSIFAGEVRSCEENSMQVPEVDQSSSDVPSTPRILLETVAGNVTIDKVQLGTAGLFLIIAGVSFFAVSRDLALAVLAAFPVLRVILSIPSNSAES